LLPGGPFRLAGTFLALTLPWAPLRAQESAPAAPSLRAGRLSAPLKLDGRLEEPGWLSADSISSLTQVTPVEGGPAASRTVIKVLASDREIVFGIVAHGAPGVPITSFTKARDTDPGNEDYLRLVLDTFRDGRSGYVFSINPTGARLDGLVVRQGEGTDASWDAIWEAATARDGNTWSVEIRIPVVSLIFRPDLTSWGFNVQRQVKATQEVTRWASASQNIQPTQTSRAGLLIELPRFTLGMGLSVRPSLVAGGGYPAPDTSIQGTLRPSLDITQRIGSNVVGSLTANTDFAETDVDTRRTNFTRFPLFFPEKRTFFLEGKDVFDFGPNLGEDVIPFFSRRIGLLGGETVPLRLGAKVNGRTGKTGFGALATRTGAVEALTEAQTVGAVRIRQDVLGESTVGAIATFGDPQGRGGALTAGADAIYHTSHFRGSKNLTLGAWGTLARREGLTGSRSAYGLFVDYPNDVWDIVGSWKRIGEGYDPSLGFVPRSGIHLYRVSVNYQPRPHHWGIRQMFFENQFSLVTDLNGRWESYQAFFAPVNWRFESGDRIEANLIPQGERLDEPFAIADTVVIQPGTYNFTRYRLEAEFAARRRISGQLTWRFGRFYGGHLHQLIMTGDWKPSASFILRVNGEHAIGRLPVGSFETSLAGVRALVNISPDLNVSSFIQYDTDSKSVGSNSRLRWTFDPAGDLFVVYNHNLREVTDRWRRESNQLLVKVQYALRR
jgi:uncharacterized protein DUF5916